MLMLLLSRFHRSEQRKKLLFLGCSVIVTPWLLPCGLLPSWNTQRQETNMRKWQTQNTATKAVNKNNSFIQINSFISMLTSFLSIFALMSLARFKKACGDKQEHSDHPSVSGRQKVARLNETNNYRRILILLLLINRSNCGWRPKNQRSKFCVPHRVCTSSLFANYSRYCTTVKCFNPKRNEGASLGRLWADLQICCKYEIKFKQNNNYNCSLNIISFGQVTFKGYLVINT